MNVNSKLLAVPTMLVIVSMLAACQTTTNTGATRTAVCSIFPNITWSSRDTAETIAQVRRHNAGRDEYCK